MVLVECLEQKSLEPLLTDIHGCSLCGSKKCNSFEILKNNFDTRKSQEFRWNASAY